MNFFGSGTAGDGSNRLIRNIALAGAAILVISLIIANSLDSAHRSGALNSLATKLNASKMAANAARAPKPSNLPGRVIGIRYGNVDYTTTSSIPQHSPRFKNVLTDPSLGTPRR